MIIHSFDEVFDYIGGFGPYQWIIFGVLFLLNLYYTVTYMGQIFMVLTPPHWCKVPSDIEEVIKSQFLGPITTEEEIKSLTIPIAENLKDFQKCKRYDIQLEQLSSLNNISQINFSNLSTIDCDIGWYYDYSYYYPTITSQLNWVCNEDWKPPLAQALFFVGCVIGIPLFGWLADRFGRIPISVVTNVIAGVFGIASSFSGSFITFCILRFLVGLSFDSNYFIVYTLGLEYVSAPYRSIVVNVPVTLCLSGSMMALPWIAYYVHDWTIFGCIIYSPMLLSVFFPLCIPESARWLIGRGKTKKVLKIIEKAAKFNKKTLSSDFQIAFEKYIFKEKEKKTTKAVTWLDFLKTPNLRKRFLSLCFLWLSISVVFDGFMRNSENIGFDFFVSFSILGAIEFPADLLTIGSLEWIGRRHTMMLAQIACGVVAIAPIFIDPAKVKVVLALAIIGKFFITLAMNGIMQYVMEVIPTVGRAQGSAAVHTVGYIMMFVSPYVVYLSKFASWIPYVFLGSLCILGSFCCFFLPETLGEKLPDSLEDGENYFANQPIFYNPFKRKRSESTKKKSGIDNQSYMKDTAIEYNL